MDWLRSLLGGGMPKPTYYGDAPRGEWPSEQALGMARQYDQAYGSTAAGFVEPNATGRMVQPRTFVEFSRAYDALDPVEMVARGKPVPANPMTLFGAARPIGQAQADRMNAANVAAQYSALSALGFDPRRLVAGEPGKVPPTNIAGAYAAGPDMMVATGNYASTPVHEGFHRGMQKLRGAGKLPEAADMFSEEGLVRAMMLRNLGAVERGRGEAGDALVARGQSINDQKLGRETLDAVERAAAEMIARDTPTGEYRRGPR